MIQALCLDYIMVIVIVWENVVGLYVITAYF